MAHGVTCLLPGAQQKWATDSSTGPRARREVAGQGPAGQRVWKETVAVAGRSLGLEARTEGPLQVLLGSPLSTSFEPLKQVQGQQPGSFCTLAGLHTCPPHRTPQPGVLARPTRPLNRRALSTHPHLVSTPWHPALPFAFLCAAEISNVSNLCYLPAANVQAFFF